MYKGCYKGSIYKGYYKGSIYKGTIVYGGASLSFFFLGFLGLI